MFKDLQSATWHQTMRKNSCYCKQDGESALAAGHMVAIFALTVDLDDRDAFLL